MLRENYRSVLNFYELPETASLNLVVDGPRIRPEIMFELGDRKFTARGSIFGGSQLSFTPQSLKVESPYMDEDYLKLGWTSRSPQTNLSYIGAEGKVTSNCARFIALKRDSHPNFTVETMSVIFAKY
jgi:hypothetical protein